MLFRSLTIALFILIFAGPAFGGSSAGGRKNRNRHVCLEYRKNEKTTYLLRKHRYQGSDTTKEALTCRECMLWKDAFLKSEGKLPLNATIEQIMEVLNASLDPVEETPRVSEADLKRREAAIRQNELRLRRWEAQLKKREAALRDREAKQATP